MTHMMEGGGILMGRTVDCRKPAPPGPLITWISFCGPPSRCDSGCPIRRITRRDSAYVRFCPLLVRLLKLSILTLVLFIGISSIILILSTSGESKYVEGRFEDSAGMSCEGWPTFTLEGACTRSR